MIFPYFFLKYFRGSILWYNNSQKNRHPFSEPAERFFLEYAQRGKWKIEREYKILKKQFELSKLKVFAEAQLVEFNLLPPEVYKASRKVTNSLSIHNHFWRSTENIALNGFLPSKLKEEGSCVISFCNRTIMITLDHKSIWKSHATLTLLATQDCPLWLQYD